MAGNVTTEQLLEAGLEPAVASQVAAQANTALSLPTAEQRWNKVSRDILEPDHPFEVHKLLHDTAFVDWDPAQGPVPAWFPSRDDLKNSNIAALMSDLNLASYQELHAWSVEHSAEFWDAMVRRLGIRFAREFKQVMDLPEGPESPRWFTGGRLNIADSCFDPADKAPAILLQPEGREISTMPRAELLSLTNRVGNALKESGLQPGDAVGIDMPMTAESVAVYLGIVKAGCVAVSVADSFAPQEIRKRLRIGNAKAVFTQDAIRRAGHTLPLYEKVVAADAPRAIVLPFGDSITVQLRDGDIAWSDFLSSNDKMDSVDCDPAAHTNILFSSGTTGDPKAIPWTHTTPIKCAADGYLHHDIRPGDVVAWPTNLGWMMGPWLIYAALINHATIALYYGTPTGREFGRFVQNTGVTMLGLVPSLVRAWRNRNCVKGTDWRRIRAFSSTGECSNADEMLFLMSLAGYRPIIEYCGGTEIGGGYITGTVVQPAAPATFSTPSLGLDFVILDDNGREADNGELFLIPPSVGLSTELLNKDHHEVYFEGTPELPTTGAGNLSAQAGVPLRRHGDQVERLGNGYFRMHGRADDTMNLSGIKVSSAEIERTLASVDDVQETAAIAVPPPEGGPSVLVIHAVPAPGVVADATELRRTMQAVIKQDLNPLFKIREVVVVDALPRTASNKVMRRVLRKAYIEKLETTT